MKELILFNMLLIVIIVGIMIVLKKYVKSSKGENIAILITSILRVRKRRNIWNKFKLFMALKLICM